MEMNKSSDEWLRRRGIKRTRFLLPSIRYHDGVPNRSRQEEVDNWLTSTTGTTLREDLFYFDCLEEPLQTEKEENSVSLEERNEKSQPTKFRKGIADKAPFDGMVASAQEEKIIRINAGDNLNKLNYTGRRLNNEREGKEEREKVRRKEEEFLRGSSLDLEVHRKPGWFGLPEYLLEKDAEMTSCKGKEEKSQEKRNKQTENHVLTTHYLVGAGDTGKEGDSSKEGDSGKEGESSKEGNGSKKKGLLGGVVVPRLQLQSMKDKQPTSSSMISKELTEHARKGLLSKLWIEYVMDEIWEQIQNNRVGRRRVGFSRKKCSQTRRERMLSELSFQRTWTAAATKDRPAEVRKYCEMPQPLTTEEKEVIMKKEEEEAKQRLEEERRTKEEEAKMKQEEERKKKEEEETRTKEEIRRRQLENQHKEQEDAENRVKAQQEQQTPQKPFTSFKSNTPSFTDNPFSIGPSTTATASIGLDVPLDSAPVFGSMALPFSSVSPTCNSMALPFSSLSASGFGISENLSDGFGPPIGSSFNPPAVGGTQQQRGADPFAWSRRDRRGGRRR